MPCLTEKVALLFFKGGTVFYVVVYTCEKWPIQYKNILYGIFVAIYLGLICPSFR
jgi:hypothetical protein